MSEIKPSYLRISAICIFVFILLFGAAKIEADSGTVAPVDGIGGVWDADWLRSEADMVGVKVPWDQPMNETARSNLEKTVNAILKVYADYPDAVDMRARSMQAGPLKLDTTDPGLFDLLFAWLASGRNFAMQFTGEDSSAAKKEMAALLSDDSVETVMMSDEMQTGKIDSIRKAGMDGAYFFGMFSGNVDTSQPVSPIDEPVEDPPEPCTFAYFRFCVNDSPPYIAPLYSNDPTNQIIDLVFDGTEGASFTIFDLNGKFLNRFFMPKLTHDKTIRPDVAIADLNNDGGCEILAQNPTPEKHRNDIYIFDATHNTTRSFDTYPLDSAIHMGILAADVNGDGCQDIVLGSSRWSEKHVVSVFDISKGEPVLLDTWRIDKKDEKEWDISTIQPILADIDGDKYLELVVPINEGDAIRILKRGIPNTADWPVFLHDKGHSGSYGTKKTPQPIQRIVGLKENKDASFNPPSADIQQSVNNMATR